MREREGREGGGRRRERVDEVGVSERWPKNPSVLMQKTMSIFKKIAILTSCFVDVIVECLKRLELQAGLLRKRRWRRRRRRRKRSNLSPPTTASSSLTCLF